MGRVLVIEFDDRDTSAFDEVMRILEKHPNFEQFKLKDESMLSLPSVDILLKRRKVYRGYDGAMMGLSHKRKKTQCVSPYIFA